MRPDQPGTRSLWAGGVTALLVPLALQAMPDVGTRYLHADHLGSTVAASDAAGHVAGHVRYRPWGGVRQAGDGGSAARFTGKARDAGTGLYYFGARYFDASSSRFQGPDPARQVSTPYAYAGNAPMARVDRDGRRFTAAEEKMVLNLLDALEEYHLSGRVTRSIKFSDLVLAYARRRGLDEGLRYGRGPLENGLLDFYYFPDVDVDSSNRGKNYRLYQGLRADLGTLANDPGRIDQEADGYLRLKVGPFASDRMWFYSRTRYAELVREKERDEEDEWYVYACPFMTSLCDDISRSYRRADNLDADTIRSVIDSHLDRLPDGAPDTGYVGVPALFDTPPPSRDPSPFSSYSDDMSSSGSMETTTTDEELEM